MRRCAASQSAIAAFAAGIAALVALGAALPASARGAAPGSPGEQVPEEARPYPPAAVDESAPRIIAVVFEGAQGMDPKALRLLVDLHEGAPLDGRDVRDAVRALHASARFSRVAAWAETVPASALPPGVASGVRVVFVLTPVRKLLSVSFPGHQALAESILHQTANLQVNAEYQPEAVPRAVEAIRAAYHRIGFRRVKVTSLPQEVGDGVQLVLRIDEGQATRIAELKFQGVTGLDGDELASAFKLAAGDVLNLALLDDGVRGVRERYRRAGRLRARVDAPLVEELDESRARVTVPVQAGPMVRFHLRGNRSFPDALLVGKLGGDGEEPLDAQMAQDMASRLRRFYIGQGFYNARVAEREMVARDHAVELVFTVDEGAPVRVEQLRFSGNKGIATEQLRERVLLLLRDTIARDPASGADPSEVVSAGVMGRVPAPPPRTKTDPERVFDPVLYSRAIKQIEDLYKSQGYLSAQAGPPKLELLDPAKDGAAVPAQGSAGDRAADLAGPGGAGAPVAGAPGAAEAGAAQAKRVPWTARPPVRVAVLIPVREGDRVMVSHILIEGGAEVSPEEQNAALVLRLGGAFSYLAAEEGRGALTSAYTRRGHLYARVEDDETFLEARPDDLPGIAHVDVRYRVQPGPVVRVGFIEVIGHRRTQESLVLDLINLHEGDLITPESLDQGQQALLRTGLFFSATLTPRNPEVAEPTKTLQVTLRERPTLELQASAGFSLADGPRTTVQWTQGNLGGRNLTFTAVAKANFPFLRYIKRNCVTAPDGITPECSDSFELPGKLDAVERVIDLGVSLPRLYPLTDKLRAGLDLIHEHAVRPSYRLDKYSAQASIELTRRRPFGAGVAYEVGFQDLAIFDRPLEDVLAGINQAIFRLPKGNMIFGSLRPSAVLDLRDDPGHPRSGLYASISGDFLKSLTQRSINVNLFKLQGLVAAYVPLPLLSSIVLSGRAGHIFQDNPQDSPGDRRFYLGGATSLRGFHEDAVQPQDVIDHLRAQVKACQSTLSGVGCTNSALALQAGATSDGGNQFLGFGAELRVPLATSVEVAFFYDAGNLWVNPPNLFSKPVLRDAVGIGLRYATPIGRIAIDLGINLNPDPDLGEPRFGPYFSIDPL